MNIKLWAGIVVAMVVLTGTGWYMSSNSINDDTMVIVSRVNTEGSGIFAREGINVTEGGGVYEQENWGGKVFATPGATSIQHMILQDLVINTFGLKFVSVPDSKNFVRSPDTVYWTEKSVGLMKALYEKKEIDGGIVWEADYTDIVETTDAKGILTTRELDPGHTCCVLAVNRTYLQNNSETVVRFLAAYTDVVDWMLDSLDESSEKYSQLVDYAKNFTGKSESVVKEALKNLRYTYEMSTMREDVVKMVKIYQRTGLVNNRVQDIGFQNEAAFADWLVNDTYLTTGLKMTKSDYTDSPKVKIRVANLVNDIHQLALYVGGSEALKTFEEYGIEVERIGPFGAGGNVADALIRGDANMGFLGAPPVVQRAINMGR